MAVTLCAEISADLRNRELVGLLEPANDVTSADCRTTAPTCDTDVRTDNNNDGAQANNNIDADTEAQSRQRRHLELGSSDDTAADADDDRVHRHQHHGHSHGDVPSNVASVAWMVIMGDGLHNFTDGLAIGRWRCRLWLFVSFEFSNCGAFDVQRHVQF
jgi:hypothetical protein